MHEVLSTVPAEPKAQTQVVPKGLQTASYNRRDAVGLTGPAQPRRRGRRNEWGSPPASAAGQGARSLLALFLEVLVQDVHDLTERWIAWKRVGKSWMIVEGDRLSTTKTQKKLPNILP